MLIAKLENKIHITTMFSKDFYKKTEKSQKRYIFFTFSPSFVAF